MISPINTLRLIGLAFTFVGLSALAGNIPPALDEAKRAAENAPRAPLIAREEFMVQATVREILMSPDGRWLAYRRDTGPRVELWLRQISDDKEHRILTDSKDTQVFWSGDGARLWLADDTGLGVFEMASMTARRVFRFDKARQQAFWSVESSAADIALLREKVPADGEWLYRYLSVDAKGRTQVLYEAQKALHTVLLDTDGNLRYAAGYDGDAFDTVLWRFNDNSRKELMRCPLPQQCKPVAFNDDTVWALAHNGSDLMSLQKQSGDSGDWKTLHSDPRGVADAVSIRMQTDGKDWLAMAYRPDLVEWHGRTAKADATLSALQQRLPGANLYISASNDNRRWLVRAKKANWYYDRYFLYDLSAETLTPLFAAQRRSSLAPQQLADAVPVHWRSKDGMALHGYVYLPKGIQLDTAPLIAFIHGGPYGRTLGENDTGTQLMVNRGHIVFKPNFRASTGYGVNYVLAARGDFGRQGVLDDIISGLDYLIANGIGNAKQQAVVGHSFGGYASLMAITHYPNRFAFAAAGAAPVDMAWTMADIAVEGGSALSADGPPVEIIFPGYGVPYDDPAWHEKMSQDSPLAHASKLSTPVYLWAGAKDDRVAVESLVRYVVDANPEFKPALLIDPNAGHSPHKRLSAEASAWLIEAAANQHFGNGVTPPSPLLQRFLNKNLRTGSRDGLKAKWRR